MAGDLPTSSQMAQSQMAAVIAPTAHPAYQPGWPPIPVSNYQSGGGPLIPPQPNPHFMPYPMMYHHMPQWGQMGPPGWPSANVTAGQAAFPFAGPNTALPEAGAPASTPPGPPAFQFPGPNNSFPDLAAAIQAGFPLGPPSYAQPPYPPTDSHPIPPGEPPFAQFYHRVPVDPSLPPAVPAVSTPSKKGSRTPKNTPARHTAKTPGKRKREVQEESPTKNPTRVSMRTRTPKKHFEMD